MSKFQQKLIHIKADLINLFIDSENRIEPHHYINTIQSSILNHFKIENCFLKFEDGMFQQHTRGIPWGKVKAYFQEGPVSPIPPACNEAKEFQGYSEMVLLKNDQTLYGMLLVKSNPLWREFSRSHEFTDFIQLFIQLLSKMNEQIKIDRQENSFKKILNVTELFHSTLDIDSILENVLETIQESYPKFHAELMLSIDQDRKTTTKIKSFDYLKERHSTVEAFVSGKMTIEEETDVTLLNAPIKGRQAIYGVLQVKVPKTYSFTYKEREFIRMLANTSGSALENAKLYNQSHRLIRNLQLINETTHRLNSKIDIHEMLSFLKEQFIVSLSPMELCFVIKEKGELKLSEASTKLFHHEEGKFYIRFVAKHFETSQEPLFIADFSKVIFNEGKYLSLMAVPMMVEEKMTGFSIALHENSYFFSFDSFKLMQALIQHSSLAISNSILRNQLQEMVDYDHLTKLHTRKYLDSYVSKSLKDDDGGMFLLLDIDDFKGINDTFGHQVGDDVLVQIGNELKNSVESKGICARWGGEELSVYIPNITIAEAEKLSKSIVEIIPEVTNPKVTVSAGMISWNKKERPDFRQLFLQADTALYMAKNSGKNQVCFYHNVEIPYS